jgi:hypothetical protein
VARIRAASRAWWRQAAAMLVCPASLKVPMVRLPQGGHDLRSAAGADLGGGLAVGDVADVLPRHPLPGRQIPGQNPVRTQDHGSAAHNLAICALRLSGRTDVTEATRWASRSMDRPLIILVLTSRS